jgi:formylglycine-generating enzyme required for sulfatase activity
MRREIEKLEEQRQDLQDKLNEQEMLSIPAGRLKMGSDEVGRENENPEHVVQIKAFYVDRFEVTNMQYKDFVDATERRTPVH